MTSANICSSRSDMPLAPELCAAPAGTASGPAWPWATCGGAMLRLDDRDICAAGSARARTAIKKSPVNMAIGRSGESVFIISNHRGAGSSAGVALEGCNIALGLNNCTRGHCKPRVQLQRHGLMGMAILAGWGARIFARWHLRRTYPEDQCCSGVGGRRGGNRRCSLLQRVRTRLAPRDSHPARRERSLLLLRATEKRSRFLGPGGHRPSE